MTDQNETNDYQIPEPTEAVKRLDRLVGTWNMTGGAVGTSTYEWLEGGFFLMQRYDFVQGDHHVKGIEVIGQERRFGEEPSEDIKSRIYDTEGNTFDYVYEIVDGDKVADTLMIWGGEKGSPAYYKGTFSDDGNTVTGEWVYPGGGGYQSDMTRVK
jgi:hypothetical protein